MKKYIFVFCVLVLWWHCHAAIESKDNDTYISEEIQEACIKYGEEYSICPELLMAMIEVESSGRTTAKNGNCIGLMQVNPKWHQDRMERLGVDDLTDMDGNIHVGTDYLSELFETYEDIGLVLDYYNGNTKAEYNSANGILSNYAKKVLNRSEELEKIHEERRKKEMKAERTRIITCKITIIEKGDLEIKVPGKECYTEVTESIKHALGADDVVVTAVQDFISEKEE